MFEPVEDGIGKGVVANGGIPLFDGQLSILQAGTQLARTVLLVGSRECGIWQTTAIAPSSIT